MMRTLMTRRLDLGFFVGVLFTSLLYQVHNILELLSRQIGEFVVLYGILLALKEAEMIFEFEEGVFLEASWMSMYTTLFVFARQVNEAFSPSVLYRSDSTARVEISLGPKTVAKLSAMAPLEAMMKAIGGRKVEEPKVVTMKFLRGTFDPSEVTRALDDFAVVSTRVCQSSEPVVEMQWKIGGEVEVKITMEQIVYDDAFMKYFYVSRFNRLDAIFE